MDLSLTSEQDHLIATLDSLYGHYATTERLREVEEVGFDPKLWEHLKKLGMVQMAVPEHRGGWGGSMLDLAVAAEQAGRHLVAAPVIESQVAARLLAGLNKVGDSVVSELLTGERMVTFAPRPAVCDVASLVPGATIADDAIVLQGDRLLLVPLRGQCVPVQNIGSMPLGDVDLGGPVSLLADGSMALEAYERAVDEWLVLTAALLVGLASRALEIGVDYVMGRRIGGTPIGAFQAISHRLADGATAVDGARLLAQEAAWVRDPEGSNDSTLGPRAAELAAMSFGFAVETALSVTRWSLHFHGGYGFMMEYDIQLYYRRARAWSGIFAEPQEAFQRAGNCRYEETLRPRSDQTT
jgi:alkylation response protein AidB-like acyl-CoA dehydrogenase